MRKIRKDDEVIVIAGKDKGKQGKVSKVADDKLLVVGVNLSKKTVRPNPDSGEAGGIKEQEMPIHASNVALVNKSSGKRDRVGFRVLQDGRKVRYFKSNDENVD